jgi:hypothetical protein
MKKQIAKMSWQVDEMASRQNGKLIKWQIDEKTNC